MSDSSPDTGQHCANSAGLPVATAQLRWVCCLLLLAALLRVIAAVAIDQHCRHAGRQFLVEGDANGYWALGEAIAAGADYAIHTPPRRILRTPGFPLLLAASIRVFGHSILMASLLLAMVGTVVCLQVYLLTRRLAGPLPALAALALAAISPLQIASSVQILSEGWFTCWVLASLLTLEPLLRAEPPQRKLHLLLQALTAGLATGAGILVRPGWILWPALATPLLLLFHRGPKGQRILLAGLLCLGSWLVLLPWAIRNHRVSGLWIHTSLWSGPSLYDGLNPQATGASDMRFLDEESLYTRFSEAEVNELYKRRALHFVLQNPQRSTELAITKSARFLSPVLNAQGLSNVALNACLLSWYLILVILTVRGLFSGCLPAVATLLLFLPFLQFLLVHMVFVGSVRYRLPVEMPLTAVAACGMVGMWQRRSGRWRS